LQDFHNLEVWQKAHTLTITIYKLTANFPADERFGLVNQLRRTSASIGANLAKGCGRERMRIFRAMYKSQWDQLVKWNITFYLREI
jgi:four helix bundle protein